MGEKSGSGRLPLRLRIRYSTIDQFIIDYTENIRRGGSFIRAEEPLQTGSRIKLDLEIAGVPVFIKLRGLVAWVNDPKGEWHRNDLPSGMGVLVLFPDEASRLLLEKLAERLEHVPYPQRKSVSPEYLKELINKLRPDIQELVKQKSSQSELLDPHIRRIFDDKESYPV